MCQSGEFQNTGFTGQLGCRTKSSEMRVLSGDILARNSLWGRGVFWVTQWSKDTKSISKYLLYSMLYYILSYAILHLFGLLSFQYPAFGFYQQLSMFQNRVDFLISFNSLSFSPLWNYLNILKVILLNSLPSSSSHFH